MRRTYACMFSILALFAVTTFAQDGADLNLKTVHLFPTNPHDAVMIVKVLKGSTEIQPDVPFEAGDNWLKQISVVVRNVSPSKIVYLNVDAHLPQSGAGTQDSPRVAAGNSVGQKPEHAMYSALTGQRRHESPREPINLEPGRELTVPIVSQSDYDNIRSLIQSRQSLADLTKCEVWVTTVFFADGTKWASGAYWRPDAATPGKYSLVPAETWAEMERAAR
ncbi:MAG: hypothetical protein WAM04_21320 [Candidatus Sulfotelmatobacter sp.]